MRIPTSIVTIGGTVGDPPSYGRPPGRSTRLETTLMTVYMVERELGGISMDDLAAAQRAAITAADELREGGSDVTYLRSVFVPATGQCRCLFESDSESLVADVQAAASLPYERIIEVLDIPPS